jgi:cobalt/nickel transport protein
MFFRLIVFLVLFFSLNFSLAEAHFGVIIPSSDIVDTNREIVLEIMFMHPFEGTYMNMKKPEKCGVMVNGKREDLLSTLKEKKHGNALMWELHYSIKRPGDHIFFVEPVPYWEPAEESFIIHYTKVIVNAFGKEQGWDEELGLKAEIIPLTRPYGLWAGNVFQGVVKIDGKAVPYAEVEVEYFNDAHEITAPSSPFVTQVIKSDEKGIFTYSMPKAGWWGFSALKAADFTLKHNNKDYPVELGAVIWVRTYTMK